MERLRFLGLAFLVLMFSTAIAQATPISFASTSPTGVTFTGSASGTTFTFESAASSQLPGYTISFEGTYTIGSMTSTNNYGVTGSGLFTITDGGSNTLSGTLSMVDLASVGSIGGTNTVLNVNLTGITVSGSDPLLTQFLPYKAGFLNTSFQFDFGDVASTLAALSPGQVASNSYSGQLSPVPEPGSILLLGTGLLTIFGLGRWKRRNRQ